MARRMQLTKTDDVDGTLATQTVRFGIDGRAYEIDVHDEHAAALRASLQQFVAAARRAGPRPRQLREAPTVASPEGLAPLPSGTTAEDVRAWAKTQGIATDPEGRLSLWIRMSYVLAHS